MMGSLDNEPVAWCPYNPKTGYEIAMARRSKETVENYIRKSARDAVAKPLYAKPIGGHNDGTA